MVFSKHFLLDPDTHAPKLLLVGQMSNQLICQWADTALLILLHRFASACSWDNLIEETGCSSALLSATNIYMVDYLFHHFTEWRKQ